MLNNIKYIIIVVYIISAFADDNNCIYCDGTHPPVEFTLDHSFKDSFGKEIDSIYRGNNFYICFNISKNDGSRQIENVEIVAKVVNETGSSEFAPIEIFIGNISKYTNSSSYKIPVLNETNLGIYNIKIYGFTYDNGVEAKYTLGNKTIYVLNNKPIINRFNVFSNNSTNGDIYKGEIIYINALAFDKENKNITLKLQYVYNNSTIERKCYNNDRIIADYKGEIYGFKLIANDSIDETEANNYSKFKVNLGMTDAYRNNRFNTLIICLILLALSCIFLVFLYIYFNQSSAEKPKYLLNNVSNNILFILILIQLGLVTISAWFFKDIDLGYVIIYIGVFSITLRIIKNADYIYYYFLFNSLYFGFYYFGPEVHEQISINLEKFVPVNFPFPLFTSILIILNILYLATQKNVIEIIKYPPVYFSILTVILNILFCLHNPQLKNTPFPPVETLGKLLLLLPQYFILLNISLFFKPEIGQEDASEQ